MPEGFLAETIAGSQYITLRSGTILDGSVTLPASAVSPGPDGNTDEETIKTITNPKLGIQSVINARPFEGGRNTETDVEYPDPDANRRGPAEADVVGYTGLADDCDRCVAIGLYAGGFPAKNGLSNVLVQPAMGCPLSRSS